MNKRPWVILVLLAIGIVAVACAVKQPQRSMNAPVLFSPEETQTAAALTATPTPTPVPGCHTYVDPDTPRSVYGGGSSGYSEWNFAVTELSGTVTAITATVTMTGSIGWMNIWIADPSYLPPVEIDPDGKEVFYDWDGVWFWCTDHRCQDVTDLSISSESTNELNSLAGTENWTGGVYAPYPETYPIGATVGGTWALIYGAIGGGGWVGIESSEITICATSLTATDTPEPEPDPTGTSPAWITEVLQAIATPNCVDWNLRGGCKWNDQFVEVAYPSRGSLAGWRLALEDASGLEVCDYTIASDNLTWPLKAFWQDYFTPLVELTPTPTATGVLTATPTGTVRPTPVDKSCRQWPPDGVAVLYDGAGIERDRRPYYNATPNISWAAREWVQPAATWEYGTPSPGMGKSVTTTPSPTP